MPTTRLIQEVRGTIAAAFSGIWLNTYEHEDAMAAIADACEKNLWDLLVWDPEYGLITKEDLAQSIKEKKPLQRLSEKNKAINPMEGMIALQNINSESISRAILVMHNFVPYFVNPQGQITQPALLQMLQSLIQKGSAKGDKETCHHVILLAYDHIAMPAELEKMMYVIDHLPPDGDELYELLKSVWPEDSDEVTTMPSRTSPEAIKLVNAASGLSRLEALGIFSKSQAANNGIVKADVLWELKAKMLRKSGLLEMLNKTDMQAADIPVGFKTIGGLNALKEYTLQMFNSPNRSIKVRPQGLTLVGPSGVGKSLFAASLGDEIGRPTLRVDVGRFMGKYVGQTEANTREAFKRLDAIAPCVAMFDEVEKAMGGQNDESGVGGRLMGAILTWLNDHTSDVFPIFTANNIKGLPPELFRAERVDGVFFLDLPNKEQRDAVWDIYIPYYNLAAEQVQEKPVDDNWTPAEIKSCCRQACLRNMTLVDAAISVVPVFKTRREEIIAQQEWASDRCLSAEYRGIFIKGKAAKMLQPGEILAKVDNRPRRRVTRS